MGLAFPLCILSPPPPPQERFLAQNQLHIDLGIYQSEQPNQAAGKNR